jgi:hypothetical protein
MRRFCREVLEFLKSEYNDNYHFEIEQQLSKPTNFLPANGNTTLTINTYPGYKIKITNDSMMYLFGWYVNGEFIEERNQYRWQKELIDMIEGG